MADTGCQSCLAGLKVIKKLGVSVRNLIPVNIKMQAANNNIRILGAALLRLSGKSNEGEERSTRQMVYVTDNTDKLFLSREACVDLRIIPNTFPTIGEAEETESANSIGTTDASLPQQECQCPKRTKPPLIPTSLPFPATEANREKLQQYLLDHYASSMFNTCEHQALPLMDSPPMRLMIDPNATPVAHHSPIPVPLHWQDAVKAGLDRDVRLGVLQPIPIGEPVTWCHCMVICAKQNGTPRRTIDFQPLNHLKHITPSHPSTRQDRSHKGRKLSLMHGTVTTAYHSTPTTYITPRLSPLGAATDITWPLKATLPRAMDTPEGTTKSPLPSPAKPNAWTIPYYGPTRLKRASSNRKLAGHLW